MTPEEVRRILRNYDEGNLTNNEFSLILERACFESVLTHLRKRNDPVISFIGGTFSGPPQHDYGMFDINQQTWAYYRFTFLNVVRLCWNKLMRAFGWHGLTKVW